MALRHENLRNAKRFFNACLDPEFWQQIVANLPGDSLRQQAVANLKKEFVGPGGKCISDMSKWEALMDFCAAIVILGP
jgi:hypothetical protein